MIASSMDIIDLSSDIEEGIIDLSSDSEDNNEFHSYREDDTDYDDAISPYHMPLVPLSTSPDQNSVEQPTSLEYDDWHEIAKKEYDDWFSSRNASSSYDDWHKIAKKEYDDWFSSRNASSSYSPVENRSTTEMSSGVSNDISRDIPLSITYGSAAKSEHFYVPSFEHQLPQSCTNESFSPQSFAPNHSSLGENRIKEEPAVKFSGFQRFTDNGNGMSSSTMPTGDILFTIHERF